MRHAFVLTLGSLLFVLAGCGVKAPVQPRQDPFLPSQIHMAGPKAEELRKLTAVDAPRLARDEEGRLLYVLVPVRSASNYDLYVDYRVSFLDANGMLLSQTGWLPKTLRANAYEEIQVNSMSPRAADFRMDIRFSQ